jgi:arabinose-5-phosphate isomerase
MELKGFKSEDFAKFHPGGSLGKKLYLRVSDLSINNEKPKVLPTQSLKEVIVEITTKRLGVTAVVDAHNFLQGIITDGDLRRMLEKTTAIEQIKAADIMTSQPLTIEAHELAVTALDLMRKKEISQLAVVENGTYTGMVHLHDLVREGLV